VKRSAGDFRDAFHVKRLAIAPIRAYQSWLSPAAGNRCKFEPSCSSYAVEAIERFGVMRGALLATWRIIRCNPFSHGGFDPVRDEFSLRAVGHIHPAEYHGEIHS
jgi:hypothetical protein